MSCLLVDVAQGVQNTVHSQLSPVFWRQMSSLILGSNFLGCSDLNLSSLTAVEYVHAYSQ